MIASFLIAAQVAGSVGAPSPDPPRFRFSALSGCRETSDLEELVVCGRRDDDRYRLPLRDTPSDPAARVRGEMPSAMAAITPKGRCGPFAGERQCSKREAEAYGYGRGRDPITALTRVVGAIVSPD